MCDIKKDRMRKVRDGGGGIYKDRIRGVGRMCGCGWEVGEVVGVGVGVPR